LAPPPVSYSVGTRVSFMGVNQLGCEADHLPLSSAEFNKMEWSYATTSPVCLYGMCRHKFICKFHFGFDVHCIIMVTTHYIRWICRCKAAGNALIKQAQTASKRWLSSLQTASWINSPHSKIVACQKYQATVSELSELKNVKANCFWYVDIALNMNGMDNWLTLWCLTSGMSMTQCDAQNVECQV
jgi:hypothetical protein